MKSQSRDVGLTKSKLYADDGRKEIPEIGKPMDGHAITVAKIKQAMEKMKAGKAAGNDNIVFELVKVLGHFGAEKLTEIANICL